MTTVRRNLIANYAGTAWSALMAVIFIPVYVRLMGIEAYGLAGFFLTLQSILSVLDLGLSMTINREFARFSSAPDEAWRKRTLLRTVEAIYWIIAIFNAVIVIAFARPIAEQWVHAEQLPIETVVAAVRMMGVVLLFQWPITLYSGGLQGLQRQVWLNVINAVSAGLRSIGAIVVLSVIAPSIIVFFAWQAIMSAVQTAVVAVVLWRALGSARGASLDRAALKSTWRFAVGMLGITVVSLAVTQIDKLVVSKLLTLSALGYYAIAAVVASSIPRLAVSLFVAVFPRLSQLAAAGDVQELTRLYHRSCEVLSVLLLPAAVMVAFFSREVLFLWTQDAVTAGQTHPILSILVVGSGLNALLHLPFALQLAYGWTRLPFMFNLASLVLLVPGVYVMTKAYGAAGAAVGWMAYNVVAIIVIPWVMHRRVLRGEVRRFYLFDVGAPLVAAVATAAVLRWLIRDGLPLTQLLFALIAAGVIVQLAAASTVATVRARIWSLVRQAVA